MIPIRLWCQSKTRDRGSIRRQLDKVFNTFVSTKVHGTGLGLAICRMIVEGHGGRLTASSDGKSGALFQFVLPIGTTDKASGSP